MLCHQRKAAAGALGTISRDPLWLSCHPGGLCSLEGFSLKAWHTDSLCRIPEPLFQECLGNFRHFKRCFCLEAKTRVGVMAQQLSCRQGHSRLTLESLRFSPASASILTFCFCPRWEAAGEGTSTGSLPAKWETRIEFLPPTVRPSPVPDYC